jgi:N-acetylglutamate synthase-like GNAT family acetyltransferase
MAHELIHDGFTVSDDPGRIDAVAAHAYLTRSYWCPGIPIEVVRRAIHGSLAFGVYEPAGAMIGLARVITDRATFAYIGDVYILEDYRKRGLSKALMRAIQSHPDLQNLRRWMLLTRDAHGLYQQFGFKLTDSADRILEMRDREVYQRMNAARPR